MKKLALIFGIAVCFAFVGCDSGNNDNTELVQDICGGVEFSKCVEYYVDRCNDSDFNACALSADLYYSVKDFANSIIGYKIACENINDSMVVTFRSIKTGKDRKLSWDTLKDTKRNSCDLVGFQYRKGDGVDKDLQKTIYYYQIACDLGRGGSCSDLGFYYDKGKGGIEKNHHKASQYYKKSCDLNSYFGCHNLGDMYYRGDGFSKNYEYAMYYFNKACDLGYKTSCKRAQILLPQMPRNNISRPYM